ncbi:ABC transporter permease [Dysgonomonas sp. 520]|uniref:ABC transporter permease n=1 Tax=Dysgonomonas sp. 520 TaxID=2302931 RepID=UPI0013D4933B|nr:ABC transporter permease [Dysgonomonas sp. 520]NDW10907.1 ABC transporter permease [Dysgonomonas sp. 520]
MFDIDKWQEIWATISRNKTRSIFTGFGVFWGIFMLVILLGLGNSFTGGIAKQVDGFAVNSCFFASRLTSEPYKGFRKGRSWNMNNRDLEVIKQRATALEYISPMLFGHNGAKNVVRGQRTFTSEVRGVYPDHFKIEQQYVLNGRLFNDLDIKYNRKSCMIGKKVYEALFDKGENPIGHYIKANGIYFQIVGVMKPKSNASIGGDVESSVYIPFTTMQQAYNLGDVIYFMGCTAKPGYEVSVLETQITEILKKNHNIAPDDKKAVMSINLETQFKMFTYLSLGVEILIWIVGMGSLLSGIIGIMNIMLVTVRERTREIGVRRALGAKPRSILTQIMSESLVLTFIAGFLGLALGVLILELIRQGMMMGTEDSFFIPPFISIGKALAALLILSVSGLLAGLLPASRALQIKAIDAIRDE